VSFEETVKPAIQHTIAISLVKNTARFEWFLEKATEIGISNFVPLICKRTERSQFKKERLEAILISAMLQSKQTWLPTLAEPILFADYCNTCTTANKLIAHCVEERKLSITAIPPAKSYTVLIGPEGDFTNEEISIALKAHFEPVALGNTRLRTETAGLVAAAWLQLTNQL
jgi:16S rRNA (uracil1498-N3)-methyltransferase